MKMEPVETCRISDVKSADSVPKWPNSQIYLVCFYYK